MKSKAFLLSLLPVALVVVHATAGQGRNLKGTRIIGGDVADPTRQVTRSDCMNIMQILVVAALVWRFRMLFYRHRAILTATVTF